MASTVREFAIKLTADTKELQTNADKASKALQTMATKLKNVFGGVDKEIKKAATAINKAIEDIGKGLQQQTQNQIQDVVRGTQERLDQVRRGAQDQQRLEEQSANQIRQIRERAARDALRLQQQQTKQQIKEVEKRIKDLERNSGTKLNILQLETQRPIDDVQRLGQALANKNKEIQNKINAELKALDGANAQERQRAEQNLIQIVNQANQQREQVLRRAAAARLRLAGNNAQERRRIEQQLQRDLTQLQQQGAKQREAIQRTAAKRNEQAAGEQQIGRIGKGGAIFGQLQGQAQGLAGALGPVGGALSSLGPAGIAAAAGIGALVGAFSKAYQAQKEFADGALKIKTLLDETQAEKLDGSLLKLRETSKTTGESIVNLENSLFNVISAVPALANNIDAAADITDKASKTAIGLGASTDEVVLAATNLGNAMGLSLEDTKNVDFIMDTLSNTMKQGVIPNASDLAANIAKTAPSMAFLFENTKDATKAIGSMTAVMTANGVKVDEAQSKMKALVAELSNSDKQAKLFAAGIEGINKETGKIEDIRKVFESMGKDVGKFSSIFSSGEAVQAVQIFAKQGGESFSKMMDTFDQAGGTAKFMFNTMSESGANTAKRLDASWNDLWITLGEGSTGIVNGIMDATATGLNALNELFKSTETKAMEAQQQFDAAISNSKAIGDSIQSVTDEINTLNAEGVTSGSAVNEAINQIGQTAAGFSEQFPLIAKDIQDIINAEGTKTVETLALLNEKLAQAQDLANAEAFLSSFEAVEQSAKVFEDTIQNSFDAVVNIGSELDLWGGAVGETAKIWASFTGDMGDVDIVGALNEQLTLTDERLKALSQEQATLGKDAIGNAERLREIQKESSDLLKLQGQATQALSATQTQINQQVTQRLEQAKQLALTRHQELDIESTIRQIQFDLMNEGKLRGESADLLNRTLNDRAVILANEVGQSEYANQLQRDRINFELQQTQGKLDQLTATGELTDAERESLETQIEKYNTQLESLAAAEDQVSATEDNVSANDEDRSILDEKLGIMSETVDLSQEDADIKSQVSSIVGDILSDESLTTDQKLAQLDAEIESLNTKEQEYNVQIQKLNAQLQEIDAQLASNQLHGEAQEKALATAKAIREQVAALREEAAIASAAASQLGVAKEGFQTKVKVSGVLGGGRGRKSGGGGGGKSKADREAEKAQKDQEREAKKAQKDREKAEKDAQKAAEKRDQEREKAAEKLEKERQKRLENARKKELKDIENKNKMELESTKLRMAQDEKAKAIAEARAAAEKKLVEDLQAFSDELRDQASQFLIGSISQIENLIAPFRSEAELLFRSMQDLGNAAEKSAENLRKQIKANEERLKAIKGEAGISGGELGALRMQESALLEDPDLKRIANYKRELRETNAQIELWEDALGDTGSRLREVNKEIDKQAKEVEQLLLKASEATGNVSSGYNQTSQAVDEASKALEIYSDKAKKNQAALDILTEKLKAAGIAVQGNTFKINGQTFTYKNYEQAVTAAQGALDALGASSKNAGRSMNGSEQDAREASKAYNYAKQDLQDLNSEAQSTRQQFYNIFGTTNIEDAEDSLQRLKKRAIELDGSVADLEEKTKNYGSELDETQKKIADLEIEEKKLIATNEKLNEELQGTGEGLSTTEAESIIQQFTALGTAFSEMGNQYQKVIEIQNQAFAAADPKEAIAKFNEADRALNKMLSDFQIFGISVDGLVEQFNGLKNIDAKGIEEILDKAFGKADTIDKTKKAERERAKVLLTSAIDLLRLQTEINQSIVDYNQSLAKTIEQTKQLHIEQQKLGDALSQANAFVESNKIDEQLTATQQLEQNYRNINNQLFSQRLTAEQIIADNEKIISQTETQLADIQNQIAIQEKNIADLQIALQAAKDAGDTEAVARINEQLANAKQTTDELSVAENKYINTIDEANNEIETQNGNLRDLNDTQKAVNKSHEDTKPIANQKDLDEQIRLQNEHLQQEIESVQKLGSAFESMADLGIEVADSVGQIQRMFEAGDALSAIETGAELTKKVGQALLNSPIPQLQTAGAVLLGVGMVSAAAIKIAKAIRGSEQTSLDFAEIRLNMISAQNEEIKNQVSLLNDLADIGAASVDTARERLKILQQQRDEIIEQNKYFGKSQETLLEEKTALENRVTQAERFNEQLETSKGLSQDYRKSLVDAVNREFGFDFDFGSNISKGEIDQVIDKVNLLIKNGEADLEAIDLITELNQSILDEQLNLIQERIDTADFKIEIATIIGDPFSFLEAAQEKTDALAESLGKAIEDATGLGFDFANFDLTRLQEFGGFIDDLFQKGEIPESVRNSYLALIENVKNAGKAEAEFVKSLLEEDDLQIQLIDAREKAGKITEEQAKEDRLAILLKEKQIIMDQIAALGTSVDLELMLLDIEGEILQLKQDQNGEDTEANRLLTEAVRKRQQLIESLRVETQGGTLSPDQQKRLEDTEKVIIQQMKDSGATDEEIQQFLKTLPAFEEGGKVPSTGPAIVHKGELVIPANMVKDYEDQIMQMANLVSRNIPIVSGNDDLTKEFSRIILEKEAVAINNNLTVNSSIGDIIINVPNTIRDAQGVAETVKAEINNSLIRTIQRGIDENKLDFRGKRI